MCKNYTHKLDMSFKLVTWNAYICMSVVHLSHHGIFLELSSKTKKQQNCSQTSYFNTKVCVTTYVLLIQPITLLLCIVDEIDGLHCRQFGSMCALVWFYKLIKIETASFSHLNILCNLLVERAWQMLNKRFLNSKLFKLRRLFPQTNSKMLKVMAASSE